MSDYLSDFFKLIAAEKLEKKRIEEEQEKLREQTRINIKPDVSSLFEQLANLKKTEKIEKIKLDKQVEQFINCLHTSPEETIVEEVVEEIVEEIIPPSNPLIEASLGILGGNTSTKTKDPLTPLNQNFATLDDLQNHYKLFLSRIQQQISTLGGGGETRLKYLDDIVGIKTNPSVYDKKYLQYNHSIGKFEFTDPSDTGGTTVVTISGNTNYYQATNTDDYIGVNSNVPVTIQLPASPVVGKKITVKDEGNKIALYNITVQVGAGVSVENDTSVVMKINHQSFTFFYNGSNWFLI
jgi:hypothetical protein